MARTTSTLIAVLILAFSSGGQAQTGSEERIQTLSEHLMLGSAVSVDGVI